MKTVLILVILLTAANVFAAVRIVPAQYSTIQSALVACKSGDTVLVKPGVYRENIEWPQTNDIHLRGSNPEQTIIDGNAGGRVIQIEGRGSSRLNADIEGFTIRNGLIQVPPHQGRKGAGIFVSRAALRLVNCIVSNNVVESTAEIQNNGGGAGVAFESTPPGLVNVISGSRILSNSVHDVSTGEGAAVTLENARAVIERTLIAQNSLSVAEVAVGTVYAYASVLELNRVIVEKNSITTTAPIIPDHAAIKGGGIFAFLSRLSLADSLVDNNLSSPFSRNERLLGAGVYYYGDAAAFRILSSTITMNRRGDHARVHGTGVYFSTAGGEGLNIINSILWDPDQGPEIFNQTQPANASHSDIRGNYRGTLLLHANPEFVSSTDFRLRATSPCIDAGDDAQSPAIDLKGINRPLPRGSHVDLGCYEIDQSIQP